MNVTKESSNGNSCFKSLYVGDWEVFGWISFLRTKKEKIPREAPRSQEQLIECTKGTAAAPSLLSDAWL